MCGTLNVAGTVLTPVLGRPRPGPSAPGSVTPTRTIVSRTVGVMVSSSGFGKRPRTTMSRTTGASAATSRTDRSFMPLTFSTAGPVIVRW